MTRAAYYRSPAWYRRRDHVRARAGRLCEFCRRRPLTQIHHRSYGHFGAEPLRELMGVCRACHRAIHGLSRRPLTCQRDSLVDRGDSGMGTTVHWQAYLATVKHAARRRT